MEEREAQFASVRQLLQAERDTCVQLQAKLAGQLPLVRAAWLQIYRQKTIVFPANFVLVLPAPCPLGCHGSDAFAESKQRVTQLERSLQVICFCFVHIGVKRCFGLQAVPNRTLNPFYYSTKER